MSLKNSPLSLPESQAKCIYDAFKRPMQDLRISVIDRCNFRCSYCMPKEKSTNPYIFLNKKDWLTFGEIIRLIKIFTQLGVTKIRLTGGEPLLRPDLDVLIKQISMISDVNDLALTTNGAFLADQATKLHGSGLSRLTVSLDTLNEKIFSKINGGRGNIRQVLDGINSAKSAGFQNIKINAVIKRGINDACIMDLVNYARQNGHILRFIEYMDAGNRNCWESTAVVKSKDILRQITKTYPLTAIKPNYYGEVAERYRFLDNDGEIGFISSVSQPFCGTCTRLRLSTDGKLYTCLFTQQFTDLGMPLRNGATDAELISIISKVWQNRTDKYSENRYLFEDLKIKTQKVEMYQIGG